MAQVSAKNFPITSSSTDLGLGDMTSNQLADDEEERKKKLLQMARTGFGDGGSSMSSMALFGGYR